MQQSRHPGIQVVIQDHGTTKGALQRSFRPLSVDEALQFSPMTSSPIFGLGELASPVHFPSSAHLVQIRSFVLTSVDRHFQICPVHTIVKLLAG